jgi:hypothetical protein
VGSGVFQVRWDSVSLRVLSQDWAMIPRLSPSWPRLKRYEYPYFMPGSKTLEVVNWHVTEWRQKSKERNATIPPSIVVLTARPQGPRAIVGDAVLWVHYRVTCCRSRVGASCVFVVPFVTSVPRVVRRAKQCETMSPVIQL